MNEHKYNNKLVELLNTPEKIELFRKDPTFNTCINCIVRGQNPVDLLLTVCNQKNELRENIENLIIKKGF